MVTQLLWGIVTLSTVYVYVCIWQASSPRETGANFEKTNHDRGLYPWPLSLLLLLIMPVIWIHGTASPRSLSALIQYLNYVSINAQLIIQYKSYSFLYLLNKMWVYLHASVKLLLPDIKTVTIVSDRPQQLLFVIIITIVIVWLCLIEYIKFMYC